MKGIQIVRQLEIYADTPNLRILISGSRDWTEKNTIYTALWYLWEMCPGNITVVHGRCPTGADAMADYCCREINSGIRNMVNIETHPADWEGLGKRAGFARNARMVQLGADVLLAFQKNNSRGTQHTIDLARKAGIVVELFTS